MLQAAGHVIIAPMEEPPDAKILILARQQASARCWAEMLQGPGTEVWLSPDEIPQDGRPEVIVTDLGEVDELEAGLLRIGPLNSGGQGAADVRLPEDVTARELRLACRLLAQIVRLRRRQRSGAQLQSRLLQEALTDPLTGLPNRRAWDQALVQRLAAAADSKRPDGSRLCLAIFDLDHFKRVNDAHGHAAGDEVLRAVGRAICDGLRQDDFVSRLGGDEFGLLLWVRDEAAAAAVVDRVRAALPSRLVQAATHAVTASAGYHLAAADAPCSSSPSPDVLYAAADAAMHEAKRQGRDRAVGG